MQSEVPVQPTWTHEEYETVKVWCHGKIWAQPYLWLWILSYNTGMTKRNACLLRWREVHLHDNGPSFIDTFRFNSNRGYGPSSLCQIPIIAGSDVHQWLLALDKIKHLGYKWADGIDDYVHQDCAIKYADRLRFATSYEDSLEYTFRKIWNRAGVFKLGRSYIHLRTTLITNLINSGAHPALIGRITGHEKIQMRKLDIKFDRRMLLDALVNAFKYAKQNSQAGLTIPTRSIIHHATTITTATAS